MRRDFELDLVGLSGSATVFTSERTEKAAVFGRQSTLAGWPGSAGSMVTSMRLSLTMTGVMRTLPFGTRKCSKRRSSTTTSPCDRPIPAAATSAARASCPASGSGAVRIELPSEIELGVIEIGECERCRRAGCGRRASGLPLATRRGRRSARRRVSDCRSDRPVSGSDGRRRGHSAPSRPRTVFARSR